jgi:glycosyltransferase involved in cell wall biosynthesis
VSARGAPVLHLVPASATDAEAAAVLGLVRALADLGRDVLVAGGRRPGPFEPGGTARRLDLELAATGPLGGRRAAARLEAAVRAQAVGLVHVHDAATAALVERVARRTGHPWVASLEAAAPAGVDPRARAYRVLVPTRELAERLDAAGTVAGARVRVVPPAIELARFDPAAVEPARLDRLRAAWDVATDRPVVLVRGALAPGGGQLELLRALRRCGRDDALVVLAGTCDTGSTYRKQLELFARTAGVEERMRIVETPADLPAAVALARVAAFPAQGEPAPPAAAVVEAQAMGTPVIVTALGGLGEMLMPAATGWLVDVGDGDGLAEALELALAMPDEVRARTAARARDFVLTQFGAERAAAAAAEVYGELLGEATT